MRISGSNELPRAFGVYFASHAIEGRVEFVVELQVSSNWLSATDDRAGVISIPQSQCRARFPG